MNKHHPKFDPKNPSGRIAFNDRGNAVWEWRTETGNFKSDIDTQQVKALQEATDVKLGTPQAFPPGHSPGSHNPYSTVDGPRETKTPRRTLDDMRKLSEQIKRARKD
jgi:hypothetical protein